MSSRLHGLPVALAVAVSLAALGFGATASAQTAVEKLYAELAQLPKEQRTARILEGAQKEDKLNFIQSIVSKIGSDQGKLFTSRFPFVKLSMDLVATEEAAERFVIEAVAGRYLSDILTAAVPDMRMILDKDLGARYKTPATDAILPQYKGFIDPQGRYTPWYWSEHGLAYNSALTPKELTPTSYWDLCKPEFRDQFSMDPAETRLLIGMYHILGEEKLKEWLACIGKNKPIIQTGHSARLELMLAGDHWATPDQYLYRGTQMQEKNPKKAPFKAVYEAPVIAYAAGMVISENTPHPYGAALLTDWALSEECQNFMKAVYRGPVAVPHPYMPENAQLVTFGVESQELTDRLHNYWDQYIGKAKR